MKPIKQFKQFTWIFALFALTACTSSSELQPQKLAAEILANPLLYQVEQMAKQAISTGVNAGDGYGEVWIRDYNTFIQLAMTQLPDSVIQTNLSTFFLFQSDAGDIVDGYVKRKPNETGYVYRHVPELPHLSAHKNTVETDQESSLVQAVYQYVTKSGNRAFLQKKLKGKTVYQRMEEALNYLLREKFNEQYGLIIGATTADWGDVQPEHAWGVAIDENTHYAIDIYDNAMLVIAINNYIDLSTDATQIKKWMVIRTSLEQNIKKHLWNAEQQKYTPHLYLDESPFPATFEEDQIYYHGGTAVAALAHLLTPKEVLQAYHKMVANVKAAHAPTIGLTLYPVYPEGYFKNKGMRPYSYQNGGDWTWFGARMVAALLENGYVQEAYAAVLPMLERVVKNKGFFEWYSVDGQPKGSGTFRGSAGVLFDVIHSFRAWSTQQLPKKELWRIGLADHSSQEFALGPDRYKDFLSHDFGYEDRSFLIGKDSMKKNFPYVLPGPADTWGGTWNTSGWRTHQVKVLFPLSTVSSEAPYLLTLHLTDVSPTAPPLLKVTLNNFTQTIQLAPGKSEASLIGKVPSTAGQSIQIPLQGVLKEGNNTLTIATLQGSWLLFDHLQLDGDAQTELLPTKAIYVRDVAAAPYTLPSGQPLLITAEPLMDNTSLRVELDGKEIACPLLEKGLYQLEIPMPAVQTKRTSRYALYAHQELLQAGTIQRAPQPKQTPADYVDTRMGTGHSRWMIAPGPWMPFGMVKLSPDNQNIGWQAGYQPTFESVGCFSHIHEWTLGGLGTMPTNGLLQTAVGDEMHPDSGYRSRIDKQTEQAPLGYYRVELSDYDITAELTATTRCSFQRYTYPKDRTDSRILVDLHIPSEYDYQLVAVDVKQVSDYRIEGISHQLSRNVWSTDANQEYTLHFVMEFDQPIGEMGCWKNNEHDLCTHFTGRDLKNAGVWVTFDTKENQQVQVRTGLSYVSLANASLNLKKEITEPFGWHFEQVRAHQKDAWNELLGRVEITTNDATEKKRFYTNMYRALCSRNIYSDVNGEWISADEKLQKFTNPKDVALGCDAFWNTFWNLNPFWNLVTPEWSSAWVRSQLAMYDANGWLAKGPAGMEYIPVMVAEHEIPLIVGAWQMGIQDFDGEKALEAMDKMQTTPSQKVCGGYAGNRDLQSYLRYHYVPADKGRFSNTMEYAFDDWCVSQMAAALGNTSLQERYAARGNWWRNAIHSTTKYAQLRNSNGKWVTPFDPFRSGANVQYVEGNAWQMTYFVPQDVRGLAKVLGKETFSSRLEWGFNNCAAWRYNAPNDQYWDFPVVQGNQQSMHFAFLFNWVDKPWLTQQWSRSILDRYYGSGISNAYLGDEDQGQMSAWFVMAAMGLFQTNGGCSVTPTYEIGSPLYEKTVIQLGGKYGRGNSFTILAHNASRLNKYVQSATLNGVALERFLFPASALLKGGSLVLQMGPKPNKKWGILPF